MRKFAILLAAASGLAMIPATAQANGWGGGFNAQPNHSSGLVNVSPSVRTGNISVLGGGILNNSPILSGNSVLSGNNTGIGVLGTGTGLLNNVLSGGKGSDRGRSHRRR